MSAWALSTFICTCGGFRASAFPRSRLCFTPPPQVPQLRVQSCVSAISPCHLIPVACSSAAGRNVYDFIPFEIGSSHLLASHMRFLGPRARRRGSAYPQAGTLGVRAQENESPRDRLWRRAPTQTPDFSSPISRPAALGRGDR